ncbi:hypothetical protein RYX45_25980, partial [Alkalihalophilus pseudofirmus]
DQAVLGRQPLSPTPWLTERHGYDPTCFNLRVQTVFCHVMQECIQRVRSREVGGQAVLGRQPLSTTPWLTERHGYD